MAKDKQLRIKITGDSRDAENALGRVGKSAHSIGKVMAAGLAIGAAAIGGLIVEMKKATDAAAVQEKAEKMLAEAMKQHGTYTDEAFKSLQQFAGAQQKLTTFGDEVTISAMQQLQTFGMDTETMKKATVAAQDLAAAKGMDLNSAAQLVGKAFAGNTATMGRYGIVLDQARLQAEGFDYVLEELNAKFGGQAQAAAATYEGRLMQMKNAFGDLQETIGFAMLPSLSLLMVSLRDVFAGWQDSGVLQNLLTPLADAFAKLAPLLGNALTSIMETLAGSGLFETITNLIVQAMQLLMPIIEQIGPPLAQAFGAVLEVASALGAALMPVFEALAPIIGQLISQVAGFISEAAPFFEELFGLLGQILGEVLETMGPVLSQLLDSILAIAAAVMPIIPIIVEALLPVIEAILPIVADVLGTIAGLVQTLAPVIQQIAPLVGEILRMLADLVARVFERMRPLLEKMLEQGAQLVEAILPLLPPVLDLLIKLLEPIIGLIDKLMPMITWVMDVVIRLSDIINNVLVKSFEWLAQGLGVISSTWDAVWNGVKSVFEGVWNGIVWFKDAIIMPIVNTLSSVWDGLENAWGTAWRAAVSVIKPMVRGFLVAAKGGAKVIDILNPFGGDWAGAIDNAIAAVDSWHSGGYIPGLGETLLPMGLFKGGEFVVRQEAARALGPERLGLINQGVSPGGGLNIYIDTMIGDKAYVDYLAGQIIERIPVTGFRRWDRV